MAWIPPLILDGSPAHRRRPPDASLAAAPQPTEIIAPRTLKIEADRFNFQGTDPPEFTF